MNNFCAIRPLIEDAIADGVGVSGLRVGEGLYGLFATGPKRLTWGYVSQ